MERKTSSLKTENERFLKKSRWFIFEGLYRSGPAGYFYSGKYSAGIFSLFLFDFQNSSSSTITILFVCLTSMEPFRNPKLKIYVQNFGSNG